MYRKSSGLFVLCIFLSASHASADLIANGSFEASPGYAFGQQGAVPPSWFVTYETPDLYSTDGSFGLLPSTGGNFAGVSASDGLGWVAGWSFFQESFAQSLATPLNPGGQYEISGYLRQAVRNDLNNPGAYRILLNDSNSLTGAFEVAVWNPTTGADVWELRTASFTAPSNANSLPWLIFQPYDSGAGGSYTGLDNVTLTAVPEPASITLLASILIPLAATRRFRNRRTY